MEPSASGYWTGVVQKAQRSLREFRIGGVATTIPFLAAILAHPDFAANHVSTGFIDAHAAALVAAAKDTTAETLLADAGSAAENGAPKAEVSATGPVGSVAIPAP